MKKYKKIIGITVTGKTLALAEVRCGANEHVVLAKASFPLSYGVNAENLSSFLKENRFTAKNAVISLSSRDALTTHFSVPSNMDRQALGPIVRLKLESELDLPIDDITADYTISNGMVNVFAVKKSNLSEIQQLLAKAGVKTIAVVLTAANFHEQCNGKICEICKFDQGCEVAFYDNNILSDVDYISIADQNDAEKEIDTFVKRTRFSGRLAEEASVRRVNNKDFEGGVEIALAVRSAGYILDGKNDFDLLNGHFHPARKKTGGKTIVRIAVWFVVAMVVLAGLGYDSYLDSREIDEATDALVQIQAPAKEAELIIERVAFAKHWFDKTPTRLQMLKDLTESFPDNGNVWLSSIASAKDLKQVITGRAVSEKLINETVDKIKLSEMFSDVRVNYIRKASKDSTIYDFQVNLKYKQEL